jgi:hypothetical protein
MNDRVAESNQAVSEFAQMQYWSNGDHQVESGGVIHWTKCSEMQPVQVQSGSSQDQVPPEAAWQLPDWVLNFRAGQAGTQMTQI